MKHPIIITSSGEIKKRSPLDVLPSDTADSYFERLMGLPGIKFPITLTDQLIKQLGLIK